MTEYSFIKKLINKIRFKNLEFCDCGTALETLSAEIYALSKEKIPVLIQTLITSTYTNTYKVKKVKDCSIFFLFSNSYSNRSDHRKTFENLTSLTSNSIVLSGRNSKKTKASNSNFIGLIWLTQILHIKQPLSYKIAVCIVLKNIYFDYLLVKSHVDRNIEKINLFVSFFDCAPIDYLVTSYCNHLNIKTSTLQHGLYFPYSGKVLNFAYRNSPSDFFLSYGLWTNEQALKVGMKPTKLVLLGCPKYINLKIDEINTLRKNIFGVVLEGISNIKQSKLYNIQLINIAIEFAKEYNLQFILRLHPNDHISNYKKIIDYQYCVKIEEAKNNISMYEFASEIDFTLSNPSTTVAELINFNKLVYILNQPDNPFDNMKNFTFNDLNQLCKIYDQHVKSFPKSDLAMLKDQFFKSGNIAEEYANFFQKFTTT